MCETGRVVNWNFIKTGEDERNDRPKRPTYKIAALAGVMPNRGKWSYCHVGETDVTEVSVRVI